MKDNASVRSPRIQSAILLAALVAAAGSIRAAEAPPPPVFPGIKPVCPCESLSRVSIPNTTIDSATLDPSTGQCRVTATVTHPPSGDRVRVFIGLPVTNWNGRFRGNGGGGFSGGSAASLAGPEAQGYAAGATDTGHEGGSGRFALDANGRLNWQAIQDNAYLGIHDMTVVGKALTRAFYGKAPRYSYFVGGSTGGRQGLMEAQRFPGDYDGIVSACPAINWHRFIPADLWPQVVMAAASNFVSKSKLAAARAAAVAACDASDGVADGVIDDPERCDYDPKALVGARIGEEIFTECDADVIRKIWEGPRGQDGTFLWHGLTRGTDLFALAGTGGTPLTGKPFSIPLEWCQYFLLQNPQWNWMTLTPAGFESLWRQSVEQYGDVIGTDDPNLRRFRDRGGKIIVCHGLDDQLVPAHGTIDYFKRLQRRMGGPERTSQFARLFLAPGVDHGFRGPGLTPTGQMEAIIRWVEHGQAPDRLLAERRDASGRVVRTRPLFPYPQVARYKGTGSTDDAANYESRPPAP
ncbi:MAG TPA: tannase/feruloyl esterase family alpha/beta hydrolase [Candidatus Paceibacterota bacterium]|nr:tannase/feruloyl esterase family alpha/beta hydrolase [Verrucomicrobiota bacterium]HOX04466.1 tannase/feruloyl esterase family alpha/beta hydrolase [Verrucomicrobiota bacterium]HRZ47408.1 tannase/feruloyl esterase family alpha/beta hydrolase [Candidatus Paceibacterota bacterium]